VVASSSRPRTGASTTPTWPRAHLGFSEEHDRGRAAAGEFSHLLIKRYRRAGLAAKLRAMLDE
jgi:hypothetical protein